VYGKTTDLPRTDEVPTWPTVVVTVIDSDAAPEEAFNNEVYIYALGVSEAVANTFGIESAVAELLDAVVVNHAFDVAAEAVVASVEYAARVTVTCE